MAQIDEVRSAVQALYHSSTEQQRNEANQWLMTFSKTAAAWQVGRARTHFHHAHCCCITLPISIHER